MAKHEPQTDISQNNTAYSRILREYTEIMDVSEAKEGAFINLEQVDGKWDKMLGEISGPRGTPYEGGTFRLEVKVPLTYPFHPPQIRFITKVWHPNISSVNGFIHLNILNDDWVPWLSLRTILLSIQGLLSTPNHPEDADFDQFHLTAQHWSNVYAGGPTSVPELDAKIHQLLDMGIDENQARVSLSNNNWDMEKALELLDFS